MSDKLYKLFLVKRRHFAGITPTIFPNGAYLMQPGAWEDMMRYTANEHSIFSLMLCDKRHPYSREERSAAFLIVNSIAFLLVAAAQTSYDAVFSTVFNVLVVAPVRIAVNSLLFQLLGCPCKFHLQKGSCLRKVMNQGGHVASFFLAVMGLLLCWASSAIITASFPSPSDQRAILWNYLYTVFITSAAQEIMLFFLMFVDVSSSSWLFKGMNTVTFGFLRIGSWCEEAIGPKFEVIVGVDDTADESSMKTSSAELSTKDVEMQVVEAIVDDDQQPPSEPTSPNSNGNYAAVAVNSL